MAVRASQRLDQKRAQVIEMVGRYPATNPRVFGSVLLGNDRHDSDIDLLVDPLPGATLFDLGNLQVELETILGLRVDLLTPGDLPLKFRSQVLAQAKPL